MSTYSRGRNLESVLRGTKGEHLFVDILHERGYLIKEVKGKEQWTKHIDYYFWKGDRVWSVDVKGLKKVSRRDKECNPDIIWVEFKNVRGNDGWLYGQSDYIACEFVDDFIVVKTTDLAKLCEKLVNKEKRVTKASEALYSLYTRRNKKDEISMIKTADLLLLPHWKLQKVECLEEEFLPF